MMEENVYFNLNLFDGNEYLFDNRYYYLVEATENILNEDWKTRIARKEPPIPKGTKLVVKKIFRNYYGTWFAVEHEGFTYYVDPKVTRYIEMLEKKHG